MAKLLGEQFRCGMIYPRVNSLATPQPHCSGCYSVASLSAKAFTNLSTNVGKLVVDACNCIIAGKCGRRVR